MDSVHIRNRLPFLLFVFSTALQDQKCIWGGLFSLIGGLEYNEFPFSYNPGSKASRTELASACR
jgi:hypothetical protein